MLRRLLDERQEALVQEERARLQALSLILAQVAGADDPQRGAALRTLAQALRQLDGLFLLVAVGEFNSGKSALINALLGHKVLEEGVTPTTSRVHLLRFGEALTRYPDGDDETLVVTYPAEWLRYINVVDTPGVNAVLLQHQAVTEDFIPRSDLVLFVTSADRAFTESERSFLERIRAWGKKVVLIVNKIDILESDEQVQHVTRFVRHHAASLLGLSPQVFPVSAKRALQAKTADGGADREALWSQSRFAPLEQFILDTLDERERMKLKLLSPVGIAERLIAEGLATVTGRLDLLRDDIQTLETLEKDLAAYEAYMKQDFAGQLARVDNILLEMSARGMDFFDETVRLARVLDLLSTERVRGEFERRVVGDTPQRVETQVSEVIDWVVERDYRQWQGMMDYLDRRRLAQREAEGHIVGQVGGAFAYNRRSLLESVGRAAREAVASYDKEKEAKALAESVRNAVAQAALVELGAVGLGAILLKVLATALADVSGILAAGALAALGFYILPARRNRAKADLRVKVAALRNRLDATLTAQFEEQLSASLGRMRDALSPYTRFVRHEQQALLRARNELQAEQAAWKRMRDAVERL
jgi:small GTP-binding protein